MTGEQDLISVRGLTDSEYGTPLRKFYGVLDNYVPEDRTFGTFVVLNFRDVEVIVSAEPYNFPIATIAIKFSKKKNSGWGVFGDSLANLLKEDEDVKDCIGRRIGMQMEEAHVYGKDKSTGEDMTGGAWTVFELEGGAAAGVSVVASKDRALELLIGKTRAEFNKAAYADPIIRKDTALQRSITDKSFINSLVQLGTVVEDENGVFQLAAQ